MAERSQRGKYIIVDEEQLRKGMQRAEQQYELLHHDNAEGLPSLVTEPLPELQTKLSNVSQLTEQEGEAFRNGYESTTESVDMENVLIDLKSKFDSQKESNAKLNPRSDKFEPIYYLSQSLKNLYKGGDDFYKFAQSRVPTGDLAKIESQIKERGLDYVNMLINHRLDNIPGAKIIADEINPNKEFMQAQEPDYIEQTIQLSALFKEQLSKMNVIYKDLYENPQFKDVFDLAQWNTPTPRMKELITEWAGFHQSYDQSVQVADYWMKRAAKEMDIDLDRKNRL